MAENSFGRIKVLDTVTANQIAAGEVVERPCSVVKELVENAIDAGADKIEIKIRDAGSTLISVSDNGCGMVPDDLVKCLFSHATSKIKKISDLDSLITLGFRGEALAAIAAVSKLKIVSKPAEQDFAYSISCEGGKHQLPIEAAAKNGTTVTVEDLFYNTPARRKFLRSDVTETAYISDYLSHLALSHPYISFHYHNENRTVFKTFGNGDLNKTVSAVYGDKILKELIAFEDFQPFFINELISRPLFTRSARKQYNFFVNNRWIQSKELARCVDEVYHTLIPQGRYPFVIIFLQLPPALVDVNVHPAKLEIKFRDFAAVEEYFKASLRNALFGKKEKKLSFGNENSMNIKREAANIHYQPVIQKAAESKAVDTKELNNMLWGKQSRIDFHDYKNIDVKQAEISAAADIPLVLKNEKRENTDSEIQQADKKTAKNIAVLYEQEAEQAAKAEERQAVGPLRDYRYSDLRILGQAAGTYIISAGENGLYITDQHAAHERLQYEKFKKEAALHGNGSSPLLIPIDLTLTHQEVMLLTKHILALADMGFVIEHFGGNSFVLRAVPLWYEGSACDNFVQDLLAEFAEGAKPDKQSVLEEKLFMAACKSAVKGNQYLDKVQLDSLFIALDENLHALTCPHGRPITIKISYTDLQKRFLRGNG